MGSEESGAEHLSKVSLVKLLLITLSIGMICSVAITLIVTLSSRTTINASDAQTGPNTGLLYYPPKPYFIVYPRRGERSDDSTNRPLGWGDVEVDRIFLPDVTRPQRLTIESTLANLKLGLTLMDGWMLTSVSIDSQSIADKVALTSGSLAHPQQVLQALERLQQARGSQQRLPPLKEALQQVASQGFALLEFNREEDGSVLRVVSVTAANTSAAGRERQPGTPGKVR
jgi:hypothetical protein